MQKLITSMSTRVLFSVYEVPLTVMQTSRRLRVMSIFWMKQDSNSLEGDSKTRSLTQSRINDWIEDCTITNTTDYDISKYNPCLRMLDINEKVK